MLLCHFTEIVPYFLQGSLQDLHLCDVEAARLHEDTKEHLETKVNDQSLQRWHDVDCVIALHMLCVAQIQPFLQSLLHAYYVCIRDHKM